MSQPFQAEPRKACARVYRQGPRMARLSHLPRGTARGGGTPLPGGKPTARWPGPCLGQGCPAREPLELGSGVPRRQVSILSAPLGRRDVQPGTAGHLEGGGGHGLVPGGPGGGRPGASGVRAAFLPPWLRPPGPRRLPCHPALCVPRGSSPLKQREAPPFPSVPAGALAAGISGMAVVGVLEAHAPHRPVTGWSL